MSTVLEQPVQVSASTRTNVAGHRLQLATTAVRLRFRWPGVRKSLSPEQKRIAACAFEADHSVLSATKKLLDTSHPAFRAVSAIKWQAIAFWREHSLPYVEPGVRLIRRQDVDLIENQLRLAQAELRRAVDQLDQYYGQLITQARENLGDLFNACDYSVSLAHEFELSWDYPATEPPDYLHSIAPEVYEEECRRVRERFNEAVQIAESTFAEELSTLVSHLADRLSGENDGKPKIFRDTAITNLREFFDRFERLNINSDEQLEQLVARARGLLGGVRPEELRDQESLRRRIAQGLVRVEASLDGYLADRPRRNILRRSPTNE
jgi:hypothetical protein